MKLLILALALFSSAHALPGLFDFFNDCLKAKFAGSTDCAILYDDDGCEGWKEPISVGYRELGWRRRNDAESIVVKKGCVFTGYQHASPDPAKRGRAVTVDARQAGKDLYRDFGTSYDLKSMISAVDCKC